MAHTSARTLTLLSILGTGVTLTAGELASRLDISLRTVRRDIDTLRDLGYDIESERGVGGGYRLGRASHLPPVVFDEDQAVATAVALQTVPTILSGIHEHAARALTTLRQAMPERSRLQAEAFTVSSARNYWEFPAPPIAAGLVRVIGTAISRQHLVQVEVAGDAEVGMRTFEPHELVVWAARWYLVAYEPAAGLWRALRLDALTPGPGTHRCFERRTVPSANAVEFVMTTHDRGDVAAEWPCLGSAILPLPAAVVARFAPGGSVVESLGDGGCRLTLGAWSWTGLAGLLLTFDTDLTDVEPAELVRALRTIGDRVARVAGHPG